MQFKYTLCGWNDRFVRISGKCFGLGTSKLWNIVIDMVNFQLTLVLCHVWDVPFFTTWCFYSWRVQSLLSAFNSWLLFKEVLPQELIFSVKHCLKEKYKVTAERILIVTAAQKKTTIFVALVDINGFFDWLACPIILNMSLNLFFSPTDKRRLYQQVLFYGVTSKKLRECIMITVLDGEW